MCVCVCVCVCVQLSNRCLADVVTLTRGGEGLRVSLPHFSPFFLSPFPLGASSPYLPNYHVSGRCSKR